MIKELLMSENGWIKIKFKLIDFGARFSPSAPGFPAAVSSPRVPRRLGSLPNGFVAKKKLKKFIQKEFLQKFYEKILVKTF